MSGDAIMDIVNQLGYTEIIHFVSRMVVNNLYQPWRAILSMINQCLTGKTSRHDRPRYPEVVQAIQTFLTNNENLGNPNKKDRKEKPCVIPYCRFTKIIICHLGRIHNIHQRSASPFHLAEDDFRLGNLKLVPKGEIDKVFGMPIPEELISNNIKNALYYNAYLEMVAKHDQKVAAEKEGKKKTPKETKEIPSKASTAKPPKLKPTKKSTKTTLPQSTEKGKVVKVRKAKSPFQLGDEPDEGLTHSEPEPELEHKGDGDEDDMELAIQMKATRPLPVVEGKGKAIATKEQAAHSLLALHTPKRRSTTNQFIFQRRTPAMEASSTGPSAQAQDDTSANIVHDSPSPADDKTGTASEKINSRGETKILQNDEEQGKDVGDQVNLDEKTDEQDQGQAGSDPGRTPESRLPPDQEVMDKDQARPDLGESCGALAGPDSEPTHDEFMADLYPKKKPNVEAEVVSMVTVPIYQASSLVYPLSTPIPVIDLSPPKPSSFTKAPIFIATTTTTTTNLPLPPPPPQQSMSDSELVARITSLEQNLATFKKKSKTLDNITQNLGSRVFNLDLRDLPHMIDEVFWESVKEAVHIALQAPLRDRFRELPEVDMKEILHQRMFESGSFKSLPEHVALYEALEASIERAQRDEFLDEKDKSNKRQCDDQDPPPPPPDLDLSKRRRHDTGASENSLLEKTGDMRTFMYWYCQQMGETGLTEADFEGQAYENFKAFYPDVIHLQFQMEECHKMLIDQIDWANPEGDQVRIDVSKPLPLSGLPGSGQAFLITKMKAARYLDFGLELLVPEHMWINKLKEITLRRPDYQEYMIAEKDFKSLYSNDFEDLNPLLLQDHLNHLSGSDKRMLSTAVKLWTCNLVIRQRVEDFQH
uniref:Histone deacetylase 14 n=1 Tax=Tanacetum cinerariifolium TaxID=118510 RepID=A0A6L2JLS9_TANCI|nr:histone deacetylase 14 [Tanacetum cinerariifolium]